MSRKELAAGREAGIAAPSKLLRACLGAVATAGVLAVSGCVGTGAADPDAGATKPGVTTSTNAPAVGYPTDADTCSAIGEVLSMAMNAEVATSEGRMSADEQSGWYRLTTLMLARVPLRDEGRVSEAVTALQRAVPPIPLGAMGRGEVGSDKWRALLPVVMQSCEDAGFEVVSVAFTGG